MLHYCLDIWTGGDENSTEKLRQGYRKHNDHIRNIAPGDRFLEYHVSQGWEPLCAFLGKPVPAEPMPRVNEGSFVVELHKSVAKMRAMTILLEMLKPGFLVVLIALGWWAFKR